MRLLRLRIKFCDEIKFLGNCFAIAKRIEKELEAEINKMTKIIKDTDSKKQKLESEKIDHNHVVFTHFCLFVCYIKTQFSVFCKKYEKNTARLHLISQDPPKQYLLNFSRRKRDITVLSVLFLFLHHV